MSTLSRTVLIVDDHPQIVRLVQSMLAARSVTVLSAKRPSDALRLCETEAVDLLISDVSMPEMDGNKLAERVLKLRPETQVLIISGVKESAHVKGGGRVRFLKKPFFPADLIRVLMEMLPESDSSVRVQTPGPAGP
jgi:CheY-like chemotaxis protein